jgi:hypothetical protein
MNLCSVARSANVGGALEEGPGSLCPSPDGFRLPRKMEHQHLLVSLWSNVVRIADATRVSGWARETTRTVSTVVVGFHGAAHGWAGLAAAIA